MLAGGEETSPEVSGSFPRFSEHDTTGDKIESSLKRRHVLPIDIDTFVLAPATWIPFSRLAALTANLNYISLQMNEWTFVTAMGYRISPTEETVCIGFAKSWIAEG